MTENQLLKEIAMIGIMTGFSVTTILTFIFHLINKYSEFKISPLRAIADALSNLGYKKSGAISLIMHLLTGSFVGAIYFLILGKLGLPQLQSVLASTAIGFGHGFVIAFLIFNSINEKASSEVIRDSSPKVSIIYLAAHVFFGLVMGILYIWIIF